MIKNGPDFIKIAIELNGDKYDYSLINYIKSSIKVRIKCNTCSYIFEQTPNNHISKKHQCPSCNGKLRFTRESILEKFKKKHGDLYDYSNFNQYINRLMKIDIGCKKCGDTFTQAINDHFKSGCPTCAGNKKYTKESIILDFNEKHGCLYEYDLSEFKNVKSKIKAFCKKHGEFRIAARHHLSGSGCQRCKFSKGELLISEILGKMSIKYEEQKKFKNCRNIRQLTFDFYLPDLDILIEYDGIQHFKSFDFFGGEDSYRRLVENDAIKDRWCFENGFKLIRIKYSDDPEAIIKSIY